MDEILRAAVNYIPLLDTKYRLVVAKNRKVAEIEITFQKSDFHHLCGLQYIKDNRQIRRNPRETTFNDIMRKKITDNTLKSSSYFNTDIEARIKNAQTLETFLDNTTSVYKFLHNGSSKIDFDFVFKNTNSDCNVYLYIIKNSQNEYTYNSFYPRDKSLQDTSLAHTKYTLLLKEKIHIPTGHVEELYKAKSYKPTETSVPKVEKFSTNNFRGTLRPALAGADGGDVIDLAMPPRNNFSFEPIKKFFSKLAKPFKKDTF